MTRWLIANWKMHGDAARVREWVAEIDATLGKADGALHCVFCPPASYLAVARTALPSQTALRLGAQNCHAEASGAFTGEISAAMIADSGAEYVILGHSERRAMGESDAAVYAKAVAAIAVGLKPILCVGESRVAYDAKATLDVLNTQLAMLVALPTGSYLVAYEPVWAIGANKTPEISEISTVHRHIKSVLGSETAVLYGGSVNATNLEEILGLLEVSGALIGGASLDSSNMKAMIEIATK